MQVWMGLLAVAALGQVPQTDVRWQAREGTKFEYSMPQFATKADWEARKAHLKNQILAAAGLLPMPKRTPVKAEVFGRLERDGYTIEKVLIETMPGYYLGGNLFRPRKAGRHPGILSPHGHWKNGRLEHTELASIPGRAINLARQGYVVLNYDMVGYNDTKQTPHVFGGRDESLFNFNPFSLQLWNSIRALDFLETLPDVDPKRLGATGASGGGTQTFFLAAVDDRIQSDVPVNMISGIMQGGSPCENAPGLRHDAFNVEFGAMMAPRPMLLVAATGDWTKNVPRVEFPAIRAIYELYDARARVEAVQFDSPHNYHQGSREAMYTFFSKHLLGVDHGPVRESPFGVEKPEDMLAWSGRALPANALDAAGVFRAWQALTRVAQPSVLAMQHALSVERAPRVVDGKEADRVVLSRAGRGDRVTGFYRDGRGEPLLVVHGDGAEAARAITAGSRPVLAIDAWGIGLARGARDEKVNHFLTFHRTDAQNRVQDILTAVAWLRARHKGSVEIRGVGQGAVWATFAAAVAGGPVKLRVDQTAFDGTRFYVPGLERVGGWKAAQSLARGVPR